MGNLLIFFGRFSTIRSKTTPRWLIIRLIFVNIMKIFKYLSLLIMIGKGRFKITISGVGKKNVFLQPW